ncbi:MAG: hypothetical protein J7M14_08135, partial [Planctomycetes bacterium]|nr:hypothetical protein [Planctomycetota bacterium]
VKSISVKISVEPVTRMAKILRLRLDGEVYRPGGTVTGKLTVRQFRRPRETIPVSFALPADLEDGQYELTTCDAVTAMIQHKQEKPQLFRARTTRELFDSIKRVVSLDSSRLYLRLPLGRGGLAMGRGELPDLPESRVNMIKAAGKLDINSFSSTLQRCQQMPYVVSGSATASFTVDAKPKEVLIHK